MEHAQQAFAQVSLGVNLYCTNGSAHLSDRIACVAESGFNWGPLIEQLACSEFSGDVSLLSAYRAAFQLGLLLIWTAQLRRLSPPVLS